MAKPQTSIPPLMAQRLLLWFLRRDLAEEVLGDLDEKFIQSVKTRSVFNAKLNYWYQVLMYFRPFAIRNYRSNSNYILMYQHNLKLTYRNFMRHKSSFFINLIGLTTGLASALLIFLWVASEKSVDSFYKNGDQLYQVYLNHEENGSLRTGPGTQILLADALADEVPEVNVALADTPADWFADNFTIAASPDHILSARGKFSDKSFFSLFTYPFLAGEPSEVLHDKHGIAISESLAMRMFGTTDVLSKSVEWHLLNFEGQAQVTGVFRDITDQSSMTFDFVLPFEVFREMMKDNIQWGNYNNITFVQLAKGTDVAALNSRIKDFVKKKADWSDVSPFFYPYKDNYLHGTFENGKATSGGRITYVRLFTLIAIFLLVIACINFMNLTTARSSRRMKEIGVKKSLGARRGALVGQYLTESVMITLLALVLSAGVVVLVLPWFNQITGKQLHFILTPQHIAFGFGIALITGLLAGSYPALYLSGFKPIQILKGKLPMSFNEIMTRKGLVIFQFTLSIIMIVSVVVVYKQLEYIQNRNLGYDRTNLLKIPLEGKVTDHLDAFIDEVKKVPGVNEVSATSHSFIDVGSYTTDVHWQGEAPGTNIKFEQARVYYDLMETMDMKIVEGRTFNRTYQDENSKIIFNEAAISAMGMEDPIGKTINMWGKDREIIGVVKDFNFASLHKKIEPLLLHFDSKNLQYIIIRLNPGETRTTISELQDFYKSFNPGYTLEYQFMDQQFQELYVAEQRVSVLSRYFAGIAILISCLGLFGLAAFTAERRQKEIGVRKILGAGALHIIRLLSTDFTRMIFIAIVIAIPISYFLVSKWLSDFAYHISLEWWFFAGASAIALPIAWLTIGVQTIKASRVNPVNCLKEE